MTLARYLLRRAVFALLFIFLVSSAAVLLTLLAPGDFVSDEVPDDPKYWELKRAELGLDRPILVQYTDWVARAVRFDFGTSLLYTRPVSEVLGGRTLNTAVLATAALVGASLLGIPLGVYTGIRTRGPGVSLVRAMSLVLLSMPPLISTIALVMLASRAGLSSGGMSSPNADTLSWPMWLVDVARHVPLPALALSLPLAAILERLQSEATRRAIQEPFVRAAEARGLSRQQAQLKHGWRVSLGAVLGFYGVMIGSLFSGSFIVEVITRWPGIGRLMYEALLARDVFLVAGCAAAGAAFLAAGTFISDVMLASADPRALLGARR